MLVFFVVIVGANRCVRPFLRGAVFVGQTRRSAPTVLVFFIVVVGANRRVRPVIALLGVSLGRHIGQPLRLLVFFVVVVGANRCVRPFLRGAGDIR